MLDFDSMSGEPSPPVALVRDFINTAELQLGTDQLVPDTATTCLQGLGVLAGDRPLAAADLPLLVGVREGLREVLLGHAGHKTEATVLRDLDRLLGQVPLSIGLAGRAPRLRPVTDRPAHQALAAVLTAVINAPSEEWRRLKVCARDSCRWAFFDASRNRSGRWCSMAGCGNIVKMRNAHRVKRESRTAPPSARADSAT
jgi:predicted RNA-binding Zn ribbon-like protein